MVIDAFLKNVRIYNQLILDRVTMNGDSSEDFELS
jgi:hypothetical protein